MVGYDGVTNLIIVANGPAQKYGQFLVNLIGSNDDVDGKIKGVKDGSVKAALFSEKKYLANEDHITSKDLVVFIGECRSAKRQRDTMVEQFNKNGMSYGWRGNKAYIKVTPQPWLAIDKEFQELYQKYYIEGNGGTRGLNEIDKQYKTAVCIFYEDALATFIKE